MASEFARVAALHGARYPKMEPRDYGKLAYQSEYGPAHLAMDLSTALAGLKAEWAGSGGAPAVPEAVGGGLCRFPLSGAPEASALALTAELFCRTAWEKRGTEAGLAEKLAVLEGLPVPGMRDWLRAYRLQGCPPVSHSEAFRQAYRPHYRLMKEAFARYFPVLLAIRRQLDAGERVLAAVDGRCGSGKTTLAAVAAEVFGCPVFHMDDYYLPPERRRPDWETVPAGNMDLERLSREVLEPVTDGRPVTVRAYQCAAGQYVERPPVTPGQLTIVEGSYSLHPILAERYSLRIFLTCAPAEQIRRLEVREGAHVQAFRDRWIPLEERYLACFDIPGTADVVLDTTDFLALPEHL